MGRNAHWCNTHSSQDQRQKAKTTECLSLYPTLYSCRSDIPLVLNDPNHDFAVLDFMKPLLCWGKPPGMTIPSVKCRYDLVTDFDDLCSLKPITIQHEKLLSRKTGDSSDSMSFVQPITHHILPVSEDELVSNYLQIEDVDVVMTSSGIKAIVDCYSKNDWILPISVKSLPNPNKPETNKTTVVIDKKIPLVSMSNHDKNVLHTKLTAKWAFILNYNDKLLPKKTTDKETSSDVKDDDHSDEKESTKVNKALKPCLEYNLWNLHKSKHFNMSKHEQRSLNILIRNRVDGKLAHYINPDRKRSVEEVYVSSKIEFQPEYGASKMSKSELVREYADLFLRQKAKLLRARSVGFTQELMLSEVLSLGDIKDRLLDLKIVPHKVFDSLYAVLTKLIDLPEGKYLLRHTTNMGHFAQLLTHNEKGSMFNLANHLRELIAKDTVVPPMDIDTSTLTGIHHKNHTPPAVFRPFTAREATFLKKQRRKFTAKQIKKIGKRRRNELNKLKRLKEQPN